MKKIFFFLLFSIALTGLSFAQITGSAHDFSAETWAVDGELCNVCHTPHNSISTVPNSPLWDHEVTTATFSPYVSNSLDATVGQPDGTSKLCLSCHDGTVALENFGGVTTGTELITGTALTGANLENDHPVSFTYDAALAALDDGLRDPTTENSGLGGTIAEDMLSGGKLQCSSCHDVHNSAGTGKLLIMANTGSALCLTCHAK